MHVLVADTMYHVEHTERNSDDVIHRFTITELADYYYSKNMASNSNCCVPGSSPFLGAHIRSILALVRFQFRGSKKK